MRSEFIFLYLDSLICQSVNVSWKIAVQNASCVFAYFCDGHKNNVWLQFFSSVKKLFQTLWNCYICANKYLKKQKI